MKQNSHHVFDQQFTNKIIIIPSYLKIESKQETFLKMKVHVDVGILIRNNYNIAVNFEYCLLLDTIPAENINAVNEMK